MRFKEIIVWLFIFVVGSLIVSFIINPSSFHSFKDRVSEKINSVGAYSGNTFEVSSYQLCLNSEFNRVTCKGICSSEGMNYRSYKCINGGLVCNCKA